METIRIAFTKGDHATQPGGIILRKKPDGEFVTHRFNRLPHTRDPKEFFWGHYFHGDGAEADAILDFVQLKNEADRRGELIEESVIIAKGDVGFDISGNWESDQ